MAHHRCRYFMKRLWLLFSQAVTVFVAAYFVVATLQPEWLGRGGTRSAAGGALLPAPATPRRAPGAGHARRAAGERQLQRGSAPGGAGGGQHQYQQGSAEFAQQRPVVPVLLWR